MHWVTAGLCLFGFAAPSAVMGSAFSIGCMGLVLGPFVLIVATVASARGAIMLLALLDAHPRCTAFDDLGGCVGGPRARRAGFVLQMGNFVCYLPVALLMCADAAAGAFDPSRTWAFGGAAGSSCDDYWILAVSALCLASTQLRTLENASSHLSFLSLACVALICAIALCLAISHPAFGADSGAGDDSQVASSPPPNSHAYHSALLFGNPDMYSGTWRRKISGFASLALGMSTASWSFCPAFLTVELASPAIRKQHFLWNVRTELGRAPGVDENGGIPGATGPFEGMTPLPPRFASLSNSSARGTVDPSDHGRQRQNSVGVLFGGLYGHHSVALSPAAAPFRKAIWLSAVLSVGTVVTVGLAVVLSWGWDVSDPLMFGVTGGYSAWEDGDRGSASTGHTGAKEGANIDDSSSDEGDFEDDGIDSWPWPKNSGPARSLCVFWFAAGVVSYALDSIAVAVACTRILAPSLFSRILLNEEASPSSSSSSLRSVQNEERGDWDDSLSTAFRFLLITLPPFLFAVVAALLVPSLLCLLAIVTSLTVPWANQVYPAFLFHVWLQRGMPGAFIHGEARHHHHNNYHHDAPNPNPQGHQDHVRQDLLQANAPFFLSASEHGNEVVAEGALRRTESTTALDRIVDENVVGSTATRGPPSMQQAVPTTHADLSSSTSRMTTVDSAASFFSATDTHNYLVSSPNSVIESSDGTADTTNVRAERSTNRRRHKELQQRSGEDLSSLLYDTGLEDAITATSAGATASAGVQEVKKATTSRSGGASGNSSRHQVTYKDHHPHQTASGTTRQSHSSSNGSLETDEWGQYARTLSSNPSLTNLILRSNSAGSDAGLLPAFPCAQRDQIEKESPKDVGCRSKCDDSKGDHLYVKVGERASAIESCGGAKSDDIGQDQPLPNNREFFKRISSGSMGYEDARGGHGVGVLRRMGEADANRQRLDSRHTARISTLSAATTGSFTAARLRRADMKFVASVGIIMVFVCFSAAVSKLSLPELRGEMHVGCSGWELL